MINGVERVVVSQMHKSAGAFFNKEKSKTSSGREVYNASIIPYRGSWLEFEFDQKGTIHFKIDKKKKSLATVLLKFLGMTSVDIVNTFYSKSVCRVLREGEYEQDVFEYINNVNYLYYPIIDSVTRSVIVKAGLKVTKRIVRKIQESNTKKIILQEDQMVGKYLYENILNEKKEVVLKAGAVITKEYLKIMETLGVKEIPIALTTNYYGPAILDTLNDDELEDRRDIVLTIVRAVGITEISDIDIMSDLIRSMFFDPLKYDLSKVGRYKLNQRLDISVKEDEALLTMEDIIKTIKILNKMHSSQSDEDDIDNLSNRRLRQVGELVENQFRSGVLRLARQLQEKSLEITIDTCLPIHLFGIKPLNSIIKEFFSLSQLSQFMDQTNPLSSLSHKRRISALGPGGVVKERATSEIRDVHPTHYGRLCVIETPEGVTAGLIYAATLFASVDQYGFMTVPYYIVENGRRTDKIQYLSVSEGHNKKLISSDNLDQDGNIKFNEVKCRYKDDVVICAKEEVNYVDVLPMQFVSLTASHIPFLNNNDAMRSLYGSNMQRQAVPLLNTDSPLVSTGVESYVVKDTGACIYAKHDGVIEYLDNHKIIIRNESEIDPVSVYVLVKYDYSNHKTCIHQKINDVFIGQSVKKGDMLAYGQAIDQEEIALGRNVLVAFMPWNGLNYEDAIIVSSRLVEEDSFTSLHVETLEVQVRDTKLGNEEITADIPGVSKSALAKLDEVGIVRIGEKIDVGDIIVGKVTPKSEITLTSEEKLLRAIFGDSASNVQNSSLFVPSGTFGTVINVEVFTKRGIEKDDRTLLIEKKKIKEFNTTREKEINIIRSITQLKLSNVLNQEVNEENFDQILHQGVKNKDIANIKVNFDKIMEKIDDEFHKKIRLMNIGHDLPQGVLKIVKVYIASKRKIQVGDKMSGRHGNKGVVSAVINQADMPFMDCGTPVDMILNSLGIPGRMNIGQILETHLGFASKTLGDKLGAMINAIDETKDIDLSNIRSYVNEIYEGSKDIQEEFNNMSDIAFKKVCSYLMKGIPFATPVFDGANYKDIQKLLELSGVDNSGQVKLRDGVTGEYFDRKITVGYKYMLKLHHLVDDKIHARSVGSYGLVNQQPIGGKKHNGGQKFGEMEAWALQAHGAAHILQEMYTVKSDEVKGRNLLYSALVSDENYFHGGVPESFKVMVKECAALCLNFTLNTEILEDKTIVFNKEKKTEDMIESFSKSLSLDKNKEV